MELEDDDVGSVQIFMALIWSVDMIEQLEKELWFCFSCSQGRFQSLMGPLAKIHRGPLNKPS